MNTRAFATLMIVAAITGCAGSGSGAASATASEPIPSSTSASGASTTTASPAPATETIATSLPLPWGLAFLPDRTALLTLRDRAQVLHVTQGAAPVSLG